MSESIAGFLPRVFAWCVHIYTASGLLIAAAIVSLLFQDERTPDTYRICFILMLVATLIDATDGTLARLARVKEVIPEFDGRRLDDLVDFLMYTCLPLLLIERSGILPHEGRWIILVALLASAYGFCQADVKTNDGSFLGFPSYWNIAAFYLYTLPIAGWAGVILIGVFAFLTFIPNRYPYPTQAGTINRLMLVLSIPWVALLTWDVSRPWSTPSLDAAEWWGVRISVWYPALYLSIAWIMALYRFAKGRP